MMHRDEHDFERDAELAGLHAELRAALPVETPAMLVERLCVLAGVSDPSLEARLREELAVDTPRQVVERATAACGVADVELDAALRAALAVEAPADLADRIHAATVAAIAPPVAGRLGFAASMVRIAGIAAVLVIATMLVKAYIDTYVGVMPRYRSHPIATAPTPAQPSLDEQIALLERTLDATAQPDALDAQIVAVESEVDDLMLAMVFEATRDPLQSDGETIEQELNLIESRMHF